ncbi:MAG: hypothetical protein KBT12_02225 [Bacteroidales bacterium]|nr:hypothetical protein [Candidatus Physcousia equi]
MVKNVKTITTLFAALWLLVSCSNEEIVSGEQHTSGIQGKVKPIEYVDEDVVSRSSLTFGENGMKFAWDEHDVLTIFPESGNATATYTLKTQHDALSASFENTGFTLTEGTKYYALSKVENQSKHPNWSFPSKENITVDFSGQRQTENGDNATTHLGEYDFMAACVTAEADNQADFYFKHLAFTLRMVLKDLPADVAFTALEVYDSENNFRQPIRHLDMTAGETTEDYMPALAEPDRKDDSFISAPRFMLLLGGEEGNGLTADAHGMLTCYMQLPPYDFGGKTMVFHLISKDGQHDYYGTYNGRKMEAGKAYQRTVGMSQATNYTLTLKLNHIWQQTHAKEVTRGTGDPGIADELGLPEHIHYVWCVGKQVKQVGKITVSGNNQEKWITATDKSISTYATPLTFTIAPGDEDKTKHLYVVASTVDLTTSSFSSINTESSEGDVKALVYAIQGDGQEASQTFLRDLYSTPWKSSTTFVGDVTDRYQDVTLYHTAAKVDLKWNSATKMTNGNVSVNNVQSSDLSLFSPTSNAASNKKDYTVSAPLTTDKVYNGRQVFFLPQFANYNVTIGEQTSDIEFTPPTEGFTSWLRALIRQ